MNKVRIFAARLFVGVIFFMALIITVIACINLLNSVSELNVFSAIGSITTIVVTYKCLYYIIQQLEKEEEKYFLTLDFSL